MKRFLILIACIGLFSQQASAGRSCTISESLKPNLPTSSMALKANSSTSINKNAAYFNTKDAVVQTFPKALATRSSTISITESDFLA
jgi:hypothetical protein